MDMDTYVESLTKCISYSAFYHFVYLMSMAQITKLKHSLCHDFFHDMCDMKYFILRHPYSPVPCLYRPQTQT